MITCMAVWVIGHPGITLGRELARSNLRKRKTVEEHDGSIEDLSEA